MRAAEEPAPAPCSAWSLQAADLAAALVEEIACWPDVPSHDHCVKDGSLVRIGPGRLVPRDHVSRPGDRALLVGCAIGARLRPHHVLAGRSALWVHIGTEFPDPIDLMTSSHRSALPAGTRVRNARFTPCDVEQISGAPVTTPARTAADLLRFEGAGAAAAAGTLVQVGLCTSEQIETHLRAAGGHRGTRRGLGLLETIHRDDEARLRACPEGTPRERAVHHARAIEQWARGEPARLLLGPGPQASKAPEPSTTLPSAVTR
ncbi:hypothetical protein DEO23_11860 [Brachybacterium endophyticum]|uniref:AbiEi antitoxin C-terminal domain-containing protein n=1 Tax=Brachybacterium endophyticum TaxID=2182385 RepID=A0A2U2RJ41_9MICO|nr:hypothetical protein [Brachybacterium endophyticum]PWH05883.1 hypothetical protein DEO23_11860 [Brachybacterium endophyticum]